MARRLNLLFLATIALTALLQNSAAQKTYTVGDALGWTVPPGGAVAYSTWAGGKTFGVGDTLVFNFTSGSHNVAGVLKAAFDACNTTNTQFVNSSGPAQIVLNSTGEHYYICTFPRHCTLGQKLAINVSAATPSPSPSPSPAPQPSSPAPSRATPAATPSVTPAPSRTPPSHAPAPGSSPSSPSPVSPPEASPPPESPTATPPSPPTPPPPSTSPPPSTTSPPPSPGNSATSLGVAGLSATLLSLLVAVFLY